MIKQTINTDNDNELDKMSVLAGAARTEHVIDMNGNEKLHTDKPLSKFMNMKVYKDGIQTEVNAISPASPYTYKYLCRMDDKPVVWSQIKNLDPMLRATKGLYMIKYTPVHSKDYRKGRAFKIGQDLIRWDVRVSGPKEWHALTERVPEFGWLARNSTLTDDWFRLAKLHPGMTLWFTVDWVRYEAKLNAQSESVLDSPFVSRKVSVDEYRKIKSQDKAVKIRYYNDVLKEINEVEALDTVQNEMREEAGEGYDRSRKCPRDPVTGRFINKKQEER